MNTRQHLKLCLVSNLKQQPFATYKPFLLQAISGGVTAVQLREKITSPALYELACQFQAVLKPQNIPLIINDDVDVACAVDAAGVHLGQSDTSPLVARKKLGRDKIIGWSIESLAQLELANQWDCIDYVAASAVFPSKTKPDCKMIWRLHGLEEVVKLSAHPVVAIGGIQLSNIKDVVAAGASGVAVIGALHQPQPALAAAQLLSAMDDVLAMKERACVRP